MAPLQAVFTGFLAVLVSAKPFTLAFSTGPTRNLNLRADYR